MAINARSMRQRLEAYVDLRRELKMQSKRLEQMRDAMGDTRSPEYGVSVSSSPSGEGVARDVIALESLEEKVNDLRAMEHDEHDALERIVAAVRNAHQRALLRMRYFDLVEWPDIAFRFYGDRIDYLTEEHEYIAKCYRLHTRAISSMVAVVRKRA